MDFSITICQHAPSAQLNKENFGLDEKPDLRSKTMRFALGGMLENLNPNAVVIVSSELLKGRH